MPAGRAQPQPTVTLGWLRIVIRILAMLLWLAVCLCFYYLWRLVRARNPWPRLFLGGMALIAGVEIVIVGERTRRGAFLLANHVSWIDILALAHASGAAFIAHDGLAAVPALRQLCEMNETVFVARHDRAGVAAQVEQVRAAIRESGALAMFPEGTTSDGTALLPFKSSLFAALDPLPEGIAVQPVLLDYGPEAAEIAWIGQEPGIDNFKRILARGRPVVLTVRFLPPLTGEDLASRKTIAAASRRSMIEAMARARKPRSPAGAG